MRRGVIGFFAAGLMSAAAVASIVTVRAQDVTPTPTAIVLPTAAFTPTATPEPIPVTIWHGWQGAPADALNSIIRDYQTAHPTIQITARYIPGDVRAAVVAAILAQRGPDLFIGESRWAGGLADAGLIAPLDARLNTTLRAQGSDVSWQTVTYNGAVYAVPHDAECLALYYNAKLLPAPPTTFDALTAPSAGSTQTPSMAFDFYTTAGLYFGLGGGLFGNELIGLNGQPLSGAADSLRQYLTLAQKAYAAQPATPAIPGGVPLASDAPFRLGQSTVWIDGNWKLADFRRSLKDSVQVAALPSLPNGKHWQPLVSTQAIYLSANSAQQSAAFDFAANLLSADAQTKLAQAGQTPVNSSAHSQDQAIATFAKQCADGVALPSDKQPALFWGPLDDAVYAVTVGGQTPNQAAVSALTQISNQLNATLTHNTLANYAAS
ncbi:MAG: sugar ABC transporter substrate-binding protein [Aggregatilineales bacterium]